MGRYPFLFFRFYPQRHRKWFVLLLYTYKNNHHISYVKAWQRVYGTGSVVRNYPDTKDFYYSIHLSTPINWSSIYSFAKLLPPFTMILCWISPRLLFFATKGHCMTRLYNLTFFCGSSKNIPCFLYDTNEILSINGKVLKGRDGFFFCFLHC